MTSSEGYAYPPAASAKRPVRVWDVTITIILLVLAAGLALIVSYLGFFLGMVSDPCGESDCDFGVIEAGILVAVGLPWVVMLAAVVTAVFLLVRRRIAFWVPLVAAALIVGCWILGATIASAGVP